MITEIDRIKMLGPMQTYQYLLMEEDAPEQLKKDMRWGFMIPPIDIYEIEGLRVKGKKGKVLFRNKAFSMTDILTDLEKRMIPAKKWLVEQAELKPIARSR